MRLSSPRGCGKACFSSSSMLSPLLGMNPGLCSCLASTTASFLMPGSTSDLCVLQLGPVFWSSLHPTLFSFLSLQWICLCGKDLELQGRGRESKWDPCTWGQGQENQHQGCVTFLPHYPLLRPRWSSWLPSVVSHCDRLSVGSGDVGTNNGLACPRNSVKLGNCGVQGR